MRVVVLEKDKSSAAYKIIKILGWVSAVLALVVCVLMIGNRAALNRSDPVHSTSLTALMEQLSEDPRNEALKIQIQEMDLLARKAFFASQQFNQRGISVLIGSLIVMVASFKIIGAYEASHPFPDANDPKDDPQEQAQWARKSVTVAGLVLGGFALTLALPWESPLDQPLPSYKAELDELLIPGTATPELDFANSESASLQFANAEQLNNHWPMFLPRYASWMDNINLPSVWNGETGEGIHWKVKLDLPGFNSPIIWEDRVYLSGASATKREVTCFDISDGSDVWKIEIPVSVESGDPPSVTEDTGYAAPTLACNGVMVYAAFANGDLSAITLDGQLKWTVYMGNPVNPYGYSSSPVVQSDMVLIQMDSEEHSFVAAYDAGTGKQKWKMERDTGASWASPLLFEWEQNPVLALAAEPTLSVYNVEDGSLIWELECLDGGEIAPSPVFYDGRLYVAADYVHVAAVDMNSASVVWTNEDTTPGISTPLVYDGLYFGGMGDGGIICFSTESGEELWYEVTDHGFYASPVRIGGKIYLFDRGGNAHVFEASGKGFNGNMESLMGESVLSTPALYKHGMIIRGEGHLFCIQE
ncbi:MAG: PQQ-like beta-propeller repeat protein [Verrucomicrobia bacterium]|jgi:outer membrane protein assembly factor BamB|nr:PQQ-like beta-propeller repeat protein [Verrucomicrobiota bacterium]